MPKKPFYLTTTLPYVNAEAHMGHALEFIRADAIARHRRIRGYDVFFNTGTDEHGQKIQEAADKAGKPVQAYVDEYAAKFRELLPALGISSDIHFIRTTDAHHERAAQEFWKRVADNGFIYKKNYRVKYCVGCELEKTDSELVDGRCPIHPNRELEAREEENYFFRFSQFGDKLLALYDAKGHTITPEFRMNEMREFIKRGLEDFSISRLKSKMSWGIPVPGDADHVMYVWFDALVNYISTLGWPESAAQFETYWKNGTPTQYCGKDNTRFQSVMWQAMLIAAGLPPTNRVVVNGFITGEGGVKMSKSLGNVVDPLSVVREYGTEALRYFLCREVSSFEDSPFTIERFKDAYNAGLANGLGNLTSRIMKMATSNGVRYTDWIPDAESAKLKDLYAFPEKTFYDDFDIQKEAEVIWNSIKSLDVYIQVNQPFKLVKSEPEKGRQAIAHLLSYLLRIAIRVEPILPETSRAIQALVRENKMPETPLFLRKD